MESSTESTSLATISDPANPRIRSGCSVSGLELSHESRRRSQVGPALRGGRVFLRATQSCTGWLRHTLATPLFPAVLPGAGGAPRVSSELGLSGGVHRRVRCLRGELVRVGQDRLILDRRVDAVHLARVGLRVVVHHSAPVAEVVTVALGLAAHDLRLDHLVREAVAVAERDRRFLRREADVEVGQGVRRGGPALRGRHARVATDSGGKGASALSSLQQHSTARPARTISGFFHLPALLEALSYSSFHTFRSFGALGRAKCVLRGAGM